MFFFAPEQIIVWALAVALTVAVRRVVLLHPVHMGIHANYHCAHCRNRRWVARVLVLTVVCVLMLTEYLHAAAHVTDLGFLALEFVNDDWF